MFEEFEEIQNNKPSFVQKKENTPITHTNENSGEINDGKKKSH